MTREELYANILRKKTFLCVGLDTDIRKIPQHLLSEEDPLFSFNKAIVDATAELCIAYKPNLAFYETGGWQGMRSLERTVSYIRETHPDMFIIADAKRGDIGNTSKMYARSFFEHLDCDAVTVAPYMGSDSVTPFLGYPGKWVILLALTSNKGSIDFQNTVLQEGGTLYQKVLRTSTTEWGGTPDNLMFVVGATRADMLADVRRTIPHNFLLVPGIGAQGGSLEEVCEYGMNDMCGLIVNNSRAIIYADSSTDFAYAAHEEAAKVQYQMSQYLV